MISTDSPNLNGRSIPESSSSSHHSVALHDQSRDAAQSKRGKMAPREMAPHGDENYGLRQKALEEAGNKTQERSSNTRQRL
jgi:hypothetical protein